jgi:hypothetical protein
MKLASSLPSNSRKNFLEMKSILPLHKMEQNVASWSKEYKENQPYPHIGIDDFFDEAVIQDIIDDYPDPTSAAWKRASFDAAYEAEKLSLDRFEDFPYSIRLFIETLNSPMFLNFLEQLTGINGLIPDPYLAGGGLHMTSRGGRLGVHADFNIHKKFNLDRRLNLLVYLNRHWQPEWGGELELWDADVKAKAKGYLPIANRIVVFSTTDSSFHGHPDPLKCPKGTFRRSIALYYYSNGRPESERSLSHSTLFRARPDESTKNHVIRDAVKKLTPPIIWELGRRFR